MAKKPTYLDKKIRELHKQVKRDFAANLEGRNPYKGRDCLEVNRAVTGTTPAHKEPPE
jgi:hypothetical protein